MIDLMFYISILWFLLLTKNSIDRFFLKKNAIQFHMVVYGVLRGRDETIQFYIFFIICILFPFRLYL